MRNVRVILLLLICGALSGPRFASGQTLQKVLLSDEFYSGQRISSIDGPPEINDEGKVVFSAFMTPGAVHYLFYGEPGALQLLAREDDPAPGLPGLLFDTFEADENKLTINPSGVVMFEAEVNSPSTNDLCLWIGTPGNVHLIGREDGPTPGLPGEFFAVNPFSGSESRLNRAGNVSFRAGRKGVSPRNGVWYGAPTNTMPAALSGFLATNVNYNYTDISLNRLTQSGRIAFSGSMTNSADKILFAGPPENLIKVLRFGEPCVGIPGVNYGGGASDGITVEYFNDDTLGFTLRISGAGVNVNNDSALWMGPAAAPKLIFREGDVLPAALGGGNISGASAFYVNTNGNLLIHSRRQALGEDILWWAPTVSGPTNWIEVAREGAPLAGLSMNLANLFTTRAFSLSDNGDVIFYGNVSGAGIGTTNDVALLRWVPATRTVHRIVQEGDLLEVAPGDFRKVTDFEFSGGPGHSASLSCGVNALGQVAFSVFFTNNGKGIMIANPPTPALTFADWAIRENLPPGQNGPGDDANSDGVANVMAYYFGFNGTQSINLSNVLKWRKNGANVELEFQRDAAVTGVTATVKVTGTLGSAWSPGPALNVVGTSGGKETVRAVIPAGGEKGFARLELSVP